MAFVTKGGRRIGKLKNEVRNFNLQLRRKVNATARSVAVQIMNDLAKKGEKGYLALKIVEIIGEDEVNNLDPETIYFITTTKKYVRVYI